MPERFHPRERIDELLARIAPERIDDVDVGVEPALEVVTDPHAFERVIGNLLTNALRYGEPPIEVRTQWNELIDLIVEDHGPGVPDEFVPLLFERFSQTDSAKRIGRAPASASRSRSPPRRRSAATFATSRPSRPAPASTSSCRASSRPALEALEPGQRVDRGASDPDLEVQMRPRRVPARPDPADPLAGLDVLADANADP